MSGLHDFLARAFLSHHALSCVCRVVYNGYSNNFIQAVVGTDSTSSQYINPGTDNLATHDTTFHSLVAPRPLHQFYGGAGSQVTGAPARCLPCSRAGTALAT